MTEPTTGCVICAARSTQDRNASIPEQIVNARGMAVDNDWTIAGEFGDENFSAYSAYSGNRGPGLESAKTCAIQAAKDTGQIAMLIAQAHDRFARGAGDAPGAPQSLGEISHELRRLNVWLRTVEDDDELRDEASVAAAIGRRAHIDSKRKSKAVSKGLRRRAADRGKLSGGPRPYGYRWEGPTGEKILVIVAAEAAVVIRIYVATIAGASQRALARSLNADRIPTVNGKAWLQATLGRLLANPIYRGQIRHAGQVYDGAHEAIITADLWDQQPRSARTPPAARVAAGRRARTCSPAVCSAAPAVRPCFPAPRRADPATRSICAPVDSLTSSVRSGPVDRALIDDAMLAELHRHYLDHDATCARLAARQAADSTIAAEAMAQAESEAQRAADRIGRVQRRLPGRLPRSRRLRRSDGPAGDRARGDSLTFGPSA
jgi:Recombinase/Resolvase, N terminal domain